MKKILFVNLELLGLSSTHKRAVEYRDEFVKYASELCKSNEENEIVFVSMHAGILQEAKRQYQEQAGCKNFSFANRNTVKDFIAKNNDSNNYFVFISGKEVDFHVAVQCKALFIVPTWISVDKKSEYYGVHVDTPEQLFMFIRTLNNQNNWYAKLQISDNVTCFSLMDARYGYYAKSQEEREMLQHFEALLKKSQSRNYYEILLYHFLAGMTNTTLFNDIELFGIIPSSNCRLNENMHNFMTQVRYIKGKRLPKNQMEYDNILIRHHTKQKAHVQYSPDQRAALGGKDEFKTLSINPDFKDKINRLKKQNKFNVIIFDDYLTHGNTFNATRNLLESLGANKIIFISLGSFGKEFRKKEYKISGSVYDEDYTAELQEESLMSFEYNNLAKDEVAKLCEIFNPQTNVM